MKSIGIIGSCVSRDLFNDFRLKDLFSVDFYSFQTNAWDMFSNGLNTPQEVINELPLENFTRRMVAYDLNKTAISKLKESGCEYVMIDLFVIWRECYKITAPNGNFVYFKNNRGKYVSDFLKKKLNYQVRQLAYENVPPPVIESGLTDLANFLKENYAEENIILHYPAFCKRYCNLNGKIVSFSQKDIANGNYRKSVVYKWTDFLHALIPNAKTLKPETFLNDPLSIHLYTDDLTTIPNPVHLSQEDKVLTVSHLMTQLNILSAEKISPVIKEFLNLSNSYVQLYKSFERVQKNTVTSLNNYFNNVLDLDRHIVIISTKNQASEKANKFFAKSKLGIKLNLSPSTSYVAIINKKDNFIYENVSDDSVSYVYKKKFKTVEVKSSYKYNISSISINKKEYSCNRRGLNFVIIDNKTMKVVDKFFCDTYVDDFLLISPNIIKKESL